MSETTTNKIEIVEHGVMLSDYFSGTSGVMLPLYVDNTTTQPELIDMLESEINMIYDHIEFTSGYHHFVGDLDKAIKTEIEKIKDYIKANPKKVCFPGLEFCYADMTKEELEEEQAVFILSIEFSDY